MAKLNFNAKKQEAMSDFVLVPEGKYIASIVESGTKKTAKGDGERLNLKFRILTGDHKNSYLFVGLNISNPNPKAVDISYRELKSIADATGHGEDEDLDDNDLHGIPMEVTVKHSAPSGEKKDNDGNITYQYGPKAEIKKYVHSSESELDFSKLDGFEEKKTTAGDTAPWEK